MEDELSVEDDVLSDLEEQLIELEIHPINNESEDDDQDNNALHVLVPVPDPICAKHQFILCHQCYRLNHTHITENKPQK